MGKEGWVPFVGKAARRVKGGEKNNGGERKETNPD